MWGGLDVLEAVSSHVQRSFDNLNPSQVETPPKAGVCLSWLVPRISWVAFMRYEPFFL